MSSEVHKAIVARWDAKSLDSTFDGGLWVIKAPLEETWPYVTLFPISDVPDGWNSEHEIREAVFQFSIWMLEAAGVDPIQTLGSLMNSIRSAYDFAPLSITGQDMLLMERTIETQEALEDEVWHATIDYRIRRGIDADYSPS